jgi:hypothetical protein
MKRWIVARTDLGAVAVPVETVRSIAVLHGPGKTGETYLTTSDGTKRLVHRWQAVTDEALLVETLAEFEARRREIKRVSRRTGCRDRSPIGSRESASR